MNRRRLEGIIDVKHSETERFEQGYLVRGVQIEVTRQPWLCRAR